MASTLNSDLPISKRAQKEARVAAKRDARAETGQECEHGIWRCKICFPPDKSH